MRGRRSRGRSPGRSLGISRHGVGVARPEPCRVRTAHGARSSDAAAARGARGCGRPRLDSAQPRAGTRSLCRANLPSCAAQSSRSADRKPQDPWAGGALAIRIYRPVSRALASEGLLGGLVYFHGGGFVTGDLDRHDLLCSQLAIDARCAVVSVDYRLAPEHKFPAAVDDAYIATSWVHENAEEIGVDHTRIAVGGDSAGATLATVVARLAKERRNPPLVSSCWSIRSRTSPTSIGLRIWRTRRASS